MEEQKDVLILAIESSCDETAAAVVKNGFLRIRLWMGHPQDRRQSGENSLRSIYS